MDIVAMLPFVLIAAGIAVLVLRGDATPRRHASVRPPDLEPPALPGRPTPTPRQPLAFNRDVTPLLANVQVARDRTVTAARPLFARATALVPAHPTAALAVVGGVALVVMLLAIVGQPHQAASPAEAQTASRNATPGASTQPSGATSTAPPVTPTAASKPPTGDAGAPLSGDGLIAAWTTAGLRVDAADQLAACGVTKPRAYRANGSQVAMVFVYPSPPALSAEWAVERGAPLAFRAGGGCLPTGAVAYWNQNIVLAFPELTDPGVKQRMSDALLRMVLTP